MTQEPEATWLTPAAHQKLVDELEHLRTVGRIEMEERIGEARSHGDISENADYDAAKDAQGLMEARIRKIEHLLRYAEVREATVTEVAEIGSIVTVVDADGDESEFFLATPENKQPGYLLASPSSPLGSALLGARIGEKVSYEAPGGIFTYEITGLRPFDG
jgi:transcription elongation factor GreA